MKIYKPFIELSTGHGSSKFYEADVLPGAVTKWYRNKEAAVRMLHTMREDREDLNVVYKIPDDDCLKCGFVV